MEPTVRQLSIVGVPTDINSSYMSGPRFAPKRIREAMFCGSSNMATEMGLELAPEFWDEVIVDRGDLDIAALSGQPLFDAIHTEVSRLHGGGDAVLAMGGDHFVSYPLIRAAAEVHDRISVLHIDAHSDLYDALEGNRFSHGSPFARLMEEGVIARLVQVGIRTSNAHQRMQAERFGVEIIEARDVAAIAMPKFSGPVYVSLDLDALDPAFAPGVSHHEPGGLTTRQVLDLLTGFSGQVVSADVVELNPHRDVHGMTAMLAAKCVKELSARLLLDHCGVPRN